MIIETSLNSTISIFSWLLPANHSFYLTHKRSVSYSSVSSVLASVQQFQLRVGIPLEENFISVAVDASSDSCSGNIVRHTNLKEYGNNGLSIVKFSVKVTTVSALIPKFGEICAKIIEKKGSKEAQSVSSVAPFAATGKQRLVVTI